MMSSKEIGAVVVGLGIAGTVRVRDLRESSCGLALRGVVSRRPVTLPNVTSLTFEEALTRSDVDVIIICTENKLHEDYARRSLENGKHVLVEFPVALSSSMAKQLYNLASQSGLVLWEENIALLTDTHKMVKAKVDDVGIKSVSFSITGNYNGWTEKFEESGLPFISGISSIQTMMHLFGNLEVTGGKFESHDDGYTATGCLKTQSQKPITITLSRSQSKERFRKKSAVYEFLDGEVIDLDKIPPKPPSKPGLFQQDMDLFYQAIVRGKNDPLAQDISIRSLEVAEKIHSMFDV